MGLPIGRTTHTSFHSPGGEGPTVLHGTWLEAESFAYPRGGFTRRAYVVVVRNSSVPADPPYSSAARQGLPYGERRLVWCSIPDMYFSIPARLRFKGKMVKGFISIKDADTDNARFTFTPEASEVK